MGVFRLASGGGVREFCHHGTKCECMRANRSRRYCKKLHFTKILQQHTDENLGDCSFLNTCFHMDSCKYIHYEVYANDIRKTDGAAAAAAAAARAVVAEGGSLSLTKRPHLIETYKLVLPQWMQYNLREFDLSVLGKFCVVMADLPWDIHMELPYGTMADDEMRRLPVPSLQEEGLIFLWVTVRAMELGRKCFKLWGYERVKTNQLQRIIRTCRTGHWLNHGKEHCLVVMVATDNSYLIKERNLIQDNGAMLSLMSKEIADAIRLTEETSPLGMSTICNDNHHMSAPTMNIIRTTNWGWKTTNNTNDRTD
jgi:mRNA (2'-O-methyladenosine-N6-)-methyltransferase